MDNINKASIVFNKIVRNNVYKNYTAQELLIAAHKIVDKVKKEKIIKKLYRKYPELNSTKIFTGVRSPGTIFSGNKIYRTSNE
jgi:trehalose/maltose hydrolase-like predicted phosphorylase